MIQSRHIQCITIKKKHVIILNSITSFTQQSSSPTRHTWVEHWRLAHFIRHSHRVTLSRTSQQINQRKQNKATQYRAFAHMLKQKQSATWNSKQKNRDRETKEGPVFPECYVSTSAAMSGTLDSLSISGWISTTWLSSSPVDPASSPPSLLTDTPHPRQSQCVRVTSRV